MAEKAFLVDTTRCIACRSCQVACKQWNQLGVEMTYQTGSHQNPADLSPTCYKLVRFNEFEERGRMKWYFFPDQCRHCIAPPCMGAAQDLGYDRAIVVDEDTGAVLFSKTEKVKEKDFDVIREVCPFDIPRYDPVTGIMSKCTMCIDRVVNGLQPACVKACPTGAMAFGDWDEIVEEGFKRQNSLKSRFPRAQLLNAEDVRTVYLVVDESTAYWEFAGGVRRSGIDRRLALRRMMPPVRRLVRLTT
jgi:formate dehydrogenase iron-sulfur subunit